MTDGERWRRASRAAGQLLERWYTKHPVILRKIAPLLPTIMRALKDADIDEIENLLMGRGRTGDG